MKNTLKKIRKEHLILIFFFLSGVFIRLFYLKHNTFIGNDGVHFTHLGKNLIESGKYVYCENYNLGNLFPPGYPIFIGLLNLFVHDLFLSGKIISLIFNIITIFLFYIIGKELYNKEAGLFSAFLYTFYPITLNRSVVVATESLFFCFLFLSIYLFIVLIRRVSFFIYILLGITIGITYLIRPDGLLLLLLPFLTLESINPLKNKSRLSKICVTVLIFILIISPYLFFLKISTGKFSLSGKLNHLALFIEEDVTDSELNLDKTVYFLDKKKNQLKGYSVDIQHSLIKLLIKEPLIVIGYYKQNSIKGIKILFVILLPIMLPLFFSFFSKDLFKQKIKWIFLLFPLLFFASNPFVIEERHVHAPVLFLALFSSLGFVNSTTVISNLLSFYEVRNNKIASFFGKNIKYIIILVLIFGFLPRNGLLTKKEFPVEHIKAGYFLKNNISKGYENLNVMHRAPWVSYYSDSRYTMLPYANYTDVINFAKAYRVDYIVADERVLKKWETYEELINLDKYSDEVELAYEDNSKKLIKLFKVKY